MNYCDDMLRIKCALKKHWKLIEQNEILREIFLKPPVIAFKANPSLRHKLVRAKLKPLDDSPQPIPYQLNNKPSKAMHKQMLSLPNTRYKMLCSKYNP